MKKFIITLIVLGAIAASVGAYYKYRTPGEEVKISKLAVARGDVIESVGATGTLQAVKTVLVGSQVSGNIKALYADFNSIVKKGQVVAELDPSLLQTQIEQARANVIRSQADLDRLKVSLEDAKVKLKRSESLAARKLVAPQELETAQVAVRSAEAQIKSSEASLTQSKASLNQNEVNLQHTVIEAPIDGIVISRNVDVGQTVAASMNAPTLFIIAEDLTKMQVNANVDESDVGRIRAGQAVKFRVDAYPLEEFTGTVSQVRLQPIVTQNVVTYATVIDVPNPQLKLKPGMTANVTIEIARKNDVLRVPNAALRFRPNADTFAALNQAVPPEMQRAAGGGRQGMGGGRPGEAGGAAAAPTAAPGAGSPAGGRAASGESRGAQNPPAPPAAGASQGQGGQRAQSAAPAVEQGQRGASGGQGGFGGGQNMDPEERRRRFQERMASMSPEERAQFEARMRERGMDPNNPGGGTPGGGRGGFGQSGAAGPGQRGQGGAPGTGRPTGQAPASANRAGAQTIDQLFGPLPVTESSGRVWLDASGQLKSVRVRLGITDGTYTELLSGELQAGQELVTAVVTPAQAAAASSRSPLMPGGPGGGRPGQGFPQQGGQRGGGR
ncbi:MAG: efflux RND transporter periplasmic adaptor subunit [Vicinamibacterales bacterium]|jgi:HlyD family secretion protein|nr:efflux RND transporter periplasmic adaptor subunit [Vicinamibacterales bacterium]